MILAYRTYKFNNDNFVLCCGIAILAYSVSAFFSTFYNNTILICSMAFILQFIVAIAIKYRNVKNIKKLFFTSLIVSSMLSFILYVAGAQVARTYLVSYDYLNFKNNEFWVAFPRTHSPRKILICLTNEKINDWVYDSKHLLRPLTMQGNIVIAGNFQSRPDLILTEVINFINENTEMSEYPRALIIHGEFELETFFDNFDKRVVSSLVIVDGLSGVMDDETIPVLFINNTNEPHSNKIDSLPNVFIRKSSYSKYERFALVEQIDSFCSIYEMPTGF